MGSLTAVHNVPLVSNFFAFANPQEFLLDTYPNAAFAYSFRKLRDAYAGSAVRIRRSSDNAESDIGFDVDGNFDAATAAAFIGGGSGFIVTWYDQSGSGQDVTQSTAADQPAYTATGISSLPMADFDGSNHFLATTGTIDIASSTRTEGTIFAVMQQDGTIGNNTLYSWSSGGLAQRFAGFPTFSDTILFDFCNDTTGRVSVAQPGGWDDTPHVLELYRDSSDNQAIVVDGNELVSAVRTVDLVSDIGVFFVGELVGDAFHFGGLFGELVIWWTDLGSNRANALADINDYYSVF